MKIFFIKLKFIFLLSLFIQFQMARQVFAYNSPANFCQKIYSTVSSKQKQKNTDLLIGYLQNLLTASNLSNLESSSMSVLSKQQLSAMLIALESGQLINPISEKQALQSSTVRIYRSGLESILNQQLDLDLLQKNLRILLNEKNREDEKRETVHVETEVPYVQVKFNSIPAGEFWMGDPSKKQVHVTLTQSFEMMQTKVTQYVWANMLFLIGETNLRMLAPSHFKKDVDSQIVQIGDHKLEIRPDNPVEKVSRDYVDVVLLKINDLSEHGDDGIQMQLSKLFPGHHKGDHYDLPTEAQWEYVATDLGRLKNKYFDRNDDSELDIYAWSSANSDHQTHPVASLRARVINGQAFYDLGGNVSEMVKDQDDSRFEPLGGVDPVATGNGIYATHRGGSWAAGNLSFLNYAHGSFFKSSPLETLGLRLIRIRNAKQSVVL